MLCRAFSQNLLNSKNGIQKFKRAWFLDVQEALRIGILIGRKLLLKSFLIFELWIGLSKNYSKFSYKSEITQKSQKLSVSGKRRFLELTNFSFSDECVTGGGWYGI